MFFPSFSKTTPFFFHGKSPQNFPRHPGPWTKSSRSLNMWSWPRTWHGCLFKVAHGLKDFLPGFFHGGIGSFVEFWCFFLSEWDRIWACPGTGFQEIPFMDFSGWIFTFCVCPQSLQHMLFGPSMNRYELQGVVVSCKSYVFLNFDPTGICQPCVVCTKSGQVVSGCDIQATMLSSGIRLNWMSQTNCCEIRPYIYICGVFRFYKRWQQVLFVQAPPH